MGGAIGGLFSAGGSIASAAISAKAAKKMQKRQHEQEFKLLTSSQLQTEARSKQAQAEGALAMEGRSRAEEARMGLFGALGDKSTYGPGGGLGGSYAGAGGFGSVGGDIYEDRTIEGRYTAADLFGGEENVPGILGKKFNISGEGFDYSASAKLLNVDNFLSSAKASTSFKVVSQLVGESADLLNRDGPAWDRLMQSTIGSINEGAATMQREMSEQISRDMARGGTARRQGLATAQRLQAAESVHRMRTQQTWQAKLGIEDYVRKNAMNTQIFAQAWTANHEGVRDQVTNAMSNLTTMWTMNALPTVMASDAANFGRYADGIRGINDSAATGFANSLGSAISGIGSLIGADMAKPGFGSIGSGISSGVGWLKNTFGTGGNPGPLAGSAGDIASGGGFMS